MMKSTTTYDDRWNTVRWKTVFDDTSITGYGDTPHESYANAAEAVIWALEHVLGEEEMVRLIRDPYRPISNEELALRRLEERAAKTDERIAELERRLAEEPIRDKYGNKTMGTTEDPPDSEIYRNLLYYPDTVEIYVGPDGEAYRLR